MQIPVEQWMAYATEEEARDVASKVTSGKAVVKAIHVLRGGVAPTIDPVAYLVYIYQSNLVEQ
jgi:hypothetical protein